MSENLSEETSRLLETAEKEAQELGASQVETSHLLLALILDSGRVGEILKSVGATEQAAREFLLNLASQNERHDGEPTISESVERVLKRAVEEAYSWRHGEVGSVHVLQCLLGIYEPYDYAFQLLIGMGVDHTALKRKVGIHLKLLPRQGAEAPVELEEMRLPDLTFELFTTEPSQEPGPTPYSVELNVSPDVAPIEPPLVAGQSGAPQEIAENVVEAPDFVNWLVESEPTAPGLTQRDIPTLITKFFTPEAQSIIERSKQMADRNFAPSVGVHHILLALLDIQGTNVNAIFNRYFHTKKMQSVLQEELPPGVAKISGGYFTQEAVVFLDLCWQTASQWKFSKITTDIMLLRLMDECNREFFKDFMIVNSVGPIPEQVFALLLKEILNLYPDIEGGLPTRFLKEQLSIESGGTYGELPWQTGATSAQSHQSPRPAHEYFENSALKGQYVQGRQFLRRETVEFPVEPKARTPVYVLNDKDESSAWMQGAKYEASRLNAPLIGVQHLLLSILVGQNSEVSSFLRAYVYADRLRMALELVVQDRADPDNLKEGRFTIAAQKVLEKAYSSSLALNRTNIAPEDLLWALLERAPASNIGGVIDGCSGTTVEELKTRVGQHFFGVTAAATMAGSSAEPQTAAPAHDSAASWSSSWVPAVQPGVTESGASKSREQGAPPPTYDEFILQLHYSDLHKSEPPSPSLMANIVGGATTSGEQLTRDKWPSRKEFRKQKTAKNLISDWFAKDVADILRRAETMASDEGVCIDFNHVFRAILLADDDARTRQILGKLVTFDTFFAALKSVEVEAEKADRVFSTRMLLAMEGAWKHTKGLGFVAGEHLLLGIFTVLASSDNDVRNALEAAANAKLPLLLGRLLSLLEPEKKAEEPLTSASENLRTSVHSLSKSYVDLSSGPVIPESRSQTLPLMSVSPNVLDVLCDALDTAKECKHLNATAYHVAHALLAKALGEQLNVSWVRREHIPEIQAYLLEQRDVKTDLEDLSGSVPRFAPNVRSLMNGAHKKAQRGFDRIVDVQHIGLALLEWNEVSDIFSQHDMRPFAIKRSLESCLNWTRHLPHADQEVGFPLDLDVLEDLYMQENLGANAKGHHDDYIKRLSSRSRYVLRSAGKASELFGNNEVAVEHVLLGLLKERECVAADVLSSQGIDFHEALTKYMSVCSKGCKRHSSAQKLSTKSHRILKSAWKFAQEFKQVLVEPEHILLSIVQEHEGVAYLAWNCLNLSAKETKSLLLSRLRGG